MGRWWEVSGDLFGGLEQLNKQTLKLALSYEGRNRKSTRKTKLAVTRYSNVNKELCRFQVPTFTWNSLAYKLRNSTNCFVSVQLNRVRKLSALNMYIHI